MKDADYAADIAEQKYELCYIRDRETYALFYVNKKTRERLGFSQDQNIEGMLCYKVLAGREEPCSDCMERSLNNRKTCQKEMFHPLFQTMLFIEDTLIESQGRLCHLRTGRRIQKQTGQKEGFPMKIVARVRSDFSTKFGIPRQSGLADALKAQVIFEPSFRSREALRGLEGYSHIWLLWQFSETARENWSPTVRPPWLGGNTRVGVFATRSPFRPSPIGLSCVKLEGIRWDEKQGPVLLVAGADLMDGTPVYDIKPYLAYTDAHPDALGGFSHPSGEGPLEVQFPPDLLEKIPEDKHEALIQILEQDPRPAYHSDPRRVYKMVFAQREIHFTVGEKQLQVVAVKEREDTEAESETE